MSSVTDAEVLKALNGVPTGEWCTLEGVMDGVEKNLGRRLDKRFLRDDFIARLQFAVQCGQAISDSRQAAVRYQITPLGQNWLTKYT